MAHSVSVKEGTVSSKFKRVVPLKSILLDLIDNNQEIKRLARYYTKTPLINRGLGYDGVLYSQPDLKDSLTLPVVEDKNASSTAKKRVLFNYAISNDVIDERQVMIYVHSPKSSFNPNMVNGRPSYGIDEIVGKHFFDINIAYPLEFNELDSVHEERANKIACLISDLVDGYEITNKSEYHKYVGNCVFRIAGEYTDLRLGVSDYMMITIPLYVFVFGGNIPKGKLGGGSHYE